MKKGCNSVHADTANYMHTLACICRWWAIYGREKEEKGRESTTELYYKHQVLPIEFSHIGFSRLLTLQKLPSAPSLPLDPLD